MIGKKDMCPHCAEKINARGQLRRVLTNAWDTQSLAWAQLLDGVRYLVVWNPLILVVTSALTYLLPHTHPASKLLIMGGAPGAPGAPMH